MKDGTVDPDRARRIGALLRDGRALLVERWERRGRDDPRTSEARRTAAPVRREQVEALLDRISWWLAGHGDTEAGGPFPLPPPERCPFRRARTPEDVSATLRELAHLRAAIVDVCAACGVRLEGEAAILVHGALDEVMACVAGAVARRLVAAADQ